MTKKAIVFYSDLYCFIMFFGAIIIMGKLFLIVLISITALSSCASLQAKLYASMIDAQSGDQILSNESNVREFLEHMLVSPEEYVITAYERCLTKDQKKRTRLMHHSYYVISIPSRNEYHTLSYFGTEFASYSRGAWAMDTDSDRYSYQNYIAGKRNWDVTEIKTGSGIDTENTVKNIIKKMDEGVHYYYRDHIRNRPGVNNCNTALWETITLNANAAGTRTENRLTGVWRR